MERIKSNVKEAIQVDDEEIGQKLEQFPYIEEVDEEDMELEETQKMALL